MTMTWEQYANLPADEREAFRAYARGIAKGTGIPYFKIIGALFRD